MSKYKSEIQVIGFKNSKYVGEVQKNQKGRKFPNGIGMLLDDLFLGCIGNWQEKQGKISPSGPVFIVYPKRQMFISSSYPQNQLPPGLWCFIEQSKGIRVYGNGKNHNLAILSTNIQDGFSTSVVCLSLQENNSYQMKKQYNCQNDKQVWECVGQILGVEVSPKYRSVQNFIHSEFGKVVVTKELKDKFLFFIEDKKYEGFNFQMNKNTNIIEQIGYYTELNGYKKLQFGRKIIAKKINYDLLEEGIFQSEDSQKIIHQYRSDHKRPHQAQKTARKYFKKAEEYNNQFIQLTEADEIFVEANNMILQDLNLSQMRNGQKILEEGPQREKNLKKNKEFEKAQKQKLETQRNKRNEEEKKPHRNMNKEYDLKEAKMLIEQQILKKKGKIGGDQIKNYDRSRSRSRDYSPSRKSSSKRQQYSEARNYTRSSVPNYNVKEFHLSDEKTSHYRQIQRERQKERERERQKERQRERYIEGQKQKQKYYLNLKNEQIQTILHKQIQMERQLQQSQRLLQVLRQRQLKETQQQQFLTQRQNYGTRKPPTFPNYQYTPSPVLYDSKQQNRKISYQNKTTNRNYSYMNDVEKTQRKQIKGSPYNKIRGKDTRGSSPYRPQTSGGRKQYQYID